MIAELVTHGPGLWLILGCLIGGACFGFFIACICISGAVSNAYQDGYQECCDDVAAGRIFDGVRWQATEMEPTSTSKPNP